MTAAVAIVFWGVLGSMPCVFGQGLYQGLGQPQQGPIANQPNPLSRIETMHSAKRSEKQKQAYLDHNFKQMKKHASDLAALANSLQKEIADTNANVLSLKIIKKAKKIQKLAKKIENEAKGD